MTAPAPQRLSMYAQFRAFLVETNAIALAIAIVIGAALGKLVTTIVAGVIMPIIGLMIPGGEWRQLKIVIDSKGNAIMVGEVLGAVIDFLIIAMFVFVVAKKIMKTPPPATK
jgi:large conductance mechanosensitive channel